MALSGGIEVTGLRVFQKGLRQLAPEIDKALKEDLTAVAEVVAADARRRVHSRTGATAKTIRAGADAKGPYVKGGKAKLPHYAWLDFGSRRANKGIKTVRGGVGPWRRSGAGPERGRFIYPAIDANRDEIVEAATKALDKAKGAAGVE